MKFCQDKEDSNIFWYVSNLLNVEHDCINAENVENAIEGFEDMIIEYIEDQINYYDDMLEKFRELKN